MQVTEKIMSQRLETNLDFVINSAAVMLRFARLGTVAHL